MDFGICLPNFQAGASGEGIDAAAEVAERLGWSTVWTTDHVIVERRSADDYGRIFEAVLTLAWLAGRHATVRLGTSVIVVPQRNAVLLAKELATLDALSGGRLIAGVGVGWDAAEFGNLGVADRFRVRGAYTDEAIRLWRHLWSGSREPFAGRFHPLTDFAFEPLPVQGDRVPIVVGGGSDAACRRAGTLGDGWQSTALGPESYGRRLPKVRAAAEAAGRPMPALSARVRVRFDEPGGPRYALRGTPHEMAADIRAFGELGVTHLALSFATTDAGEIVERARRFAAEVLPLV